MNILPSPSTPPTPPPAANTPKIQEGLRYLTPLVDDGNANIQHLSDYKTDPQGKLVPNASRVLITTADRADTINITIGADQQLNARINGKDYKLPLNANNDVHSLRIQTQGGNDRITVDKNINIEMHIDGGDGDDYIEANGRTGSVLGGKGNDYIRLGTGHMVALGGDGDDIMIAGTGNSTMLGQKGNDKLYADYPAPKTNLRQVYLNGGQGNDELYAGTGKTILNGGPGNDKHVGYRQTTFYTGAGQDTVHSYDVQDRIYAKKTDTIHKPAQVNTTHVEYNSNAGKKGLKIEGTPEFTEQTEDYLEQLRGSPVGQKVLQEMDRLAEKNGTHVTISRSPLFEANTYSQSNSVGEIPRASRLPEHEFLPEYGHITNGVAGSKAVDGVIGFLPEHFTKAFDTSPLIAMDHETIHAIVFAEGKGIAGDKPIFDKEGKPVMFQGAQLRVKNAEYQAVGLPTKTRPFDFDNDPSTPPTTTNTSPFTENALREEMGIPLRDRYAEEEPPLIG
ncbi:Effector protein [Pseudomonas gessardii]|uniref:M91 family zinc metallopeptidase n=1 Tax=Pseudomonas gessardii TaxID=78544 RepID=UPI00088A981F|nr:M91 family zinc metallopeptidase [Pseudomonas gessardii]MRU49604.1 hemolysin [Pseudomonas gessardii]SDR02838.1 Effector protein [Pseudomonas gessardii]